MAHATCWTILRRRPERSPRQELAVPKLLVQALVWPRVEVSSCELSAKASLASALLAFSQNTPATDQAEVNVEGISVLKKACEDPRLKFGEKSGTESKIKPLNESKLDKSKNEWEPKSRAKTEGKLEVASSLETEDTKTDCRKLRVESETKSKTDLKPNKSENEWEPKLRAEVDEKLEAESNLETEDTKGDGSKTETRGRVSNEANCGILSDTTIYRLEGYTSRLVYYRLMVPNWLRQNATWSCEYDGNDLNLDIKADASNWENIFRVQILPPLRYADCEDITVKMVIGVLLPEKASELDSNMSYMISDGHYALGFQLNNPLQDYPSRGPYQALEGKVGSKCLLNPNTKLAATVVTASKNNPSQFEMRFKPSEAWGSAYCTLDEGHKILAQYSTPLRLRNGLRLEVYRHTKKERYRINYVEIFVYHDSPELPLATASPQGYH